MPVDELEGDDGEVAGGVADELDPVEPDPVLDPVDPVLDPVDPVPLPVPLLGELDVPGLEVPDPAPSRESLQATVPATVKKARVTSAAVRRMRMVSSFSA